MQPRSLIATLLGSTIWLGLVVGRLASVNKAMWIARDDAVITLSHARNAADFGSIGVSPGGDRVEGFSSPLHFLVSYLIQLASNPGYESLSIAILIAMSAAAGAAVVACLRQLARHKQMDSIRSDALAVGLTALVALCVISSWTSVGWIGSGMENPVVICAGVVVALMASTAPTSWRTQVLLVFALALFMIARVEFAGFSVPLVFAASWAYARRGPAPQQVRTAAATASAALGLVALVHIARRWYFGDWLPNTAVVQDRSSGFEQKLLIVLISAVPLVVLWTAIVASAGTKSKKHAGRVSDLRIVGGVLLIGLALMVLSGRSAGSLGDLLSLEILPLLLAVVGLLLGALRYFSASPWFMNHVFGALSLVPIGQYLALGPARLDPHRVAAMAVPFLALWIAALTLRLIAESTSQPSRAIARSTRLGFVGLIAVVLSFGLLFVAANDGPRHLDYDVSSASQIVSVVQGIRDAHLGEGMPILANPDLGKVSFAKNSVIVDLGLLGDPLLTRITRQRPDLVVAYLELVARPDVVEAHGFWSCRFDAWLRSPDFAASYELSDPRWLDGQVQSDGCVLDGRYAIWVRIDADAEYQLARELIAAPDPASVVAASLDLCTRSAGNILRCQGVRRSVQRAAPSLRSANTFDQAVDAMAASPSAALDVPLLRRDAGWADDAFVGLVGLFEGG